MTEKTYIVRAQVQAADADLLAGDHVPAAIRERFAGTAVRIIECEPQPAPAPVHFSADSYPVTVGAKFWNNDLRVCQITEVGTQDTRPYADTGEYATWHKHTDGSSDTLTGSMRPYGRLTRFYPPGGADAERYPPGTNYRDVR